MKQDSSKQTTTNRIDPLEFENSRVYFTQFDRVTYSQVEWTTEEVESIKRDLQRRIKLLALTKGHVVIAASHLLESELARDILLPYPELFTERIIVPALRSEFTSCAAFLDSKLDGALPGEADLYRGPEQHDMARMIDDLALAVRWDTSKTSGWFQSRLIGDLRSGKSVVGLALARASLNVPSSMIGELESQASLTRGFVYKSAERHGPLKFREIICAYADFLYYLSGARAVNSEGVLPQGSIVDFSITDLGHRRTSLSDHEVFFKLFVDLTKAATSSYFPSDLLDALEIGDAIELHQVATDHDFIKKYNAIQEKTKEGLEIADPERLVLVMSELNEYEHDLKQSYKAAFDRELPQYLREQEEERVAEFLHSVASLVLTPYGIVAGAKDVLVSGLRSLNQVDLADAIDTKIDTGLSALEDVARRATNDEGPIFLEFTDKLKSAYKKKLSGR